MNKPVTVSRIKAPPIYIAFVIQFISCLILTLAAWLMIDIVAAYSMLLGGLISILPGCYFARKAFRYRGASNTALIVKSFYAGEAGKLGMTTVMFALVFAGVKPLNELVLMASFIVTLIIGFIATVYVGLKPAQRYK